MTTTASNSIHNPHEDSPVKNPSTTVSAQSVSSSGNMGSPLSRAEKPTTVATTPASDDPALCQYFVIPLWRGNGYGTMFAQGTEAMFSNLGHFTSVSIRVSGGSMSECCTSVLSLASHPFNICPCWPCLLQIRDAVQARAGQDKNHGVILIPEGIVESIHELYALLKEGVHADNISTQLSPWSSTLFEFLPPFIKKQLAFAFLVYPCLVVQYMGQSAFLSKNLGLFPTIFTVQSQRERFISKRMANFGEGRRRGTGGMLPLLAISTVAEYYRLPWKPPVTAGLLAANTLVYLRPAFLDPLIPHISEVWFNPNLILKHKDLKRFFLSAFYHLNEPHLVYNMMSLLWKGIKLETSMGSTQFASMVVTLLGISQGVTLLLAKSLHVFFDYRRAYFHEYSVGFSGVLFALKVVLNAQAEDYSSVYGVLVPTKYAAWAELVLVQIFVPRASFLGHLGGILAGILYMKMKRSYSGSDPVAMVVRGVARAVTWPLRFLSSMVGSRRRRITGRGRVGRGQNGIAGPGIWRCQSCTFDNSGWESVCEMCGSGRSRGNGWSVNQGHAHSSSSSSDLPLDELRRRRVERFS
ncbi:PREDICTED: rhomboid-like protein 14, mitochondrial isoform X2 [Brassica oleracea var. oleracea]|uniref:rhomboid-like protein 14, mitochondrial isoform X2 n=2 Tax=Brassica oleracea var. oleracea TaxID=109376 RepID=UPI0006A6D0A3|nr:PREDICTED: rhomboid-like protein 14, mitochondrial isoform X2 [Brassica oleracea var. oleracea]